MYKNKTIEVLNCQRVALHGCHLAKSRLPVTQIDACPGWDMYRRRSDPKNDTFFLKSLLWITSFIVNQTRLVLSILRPLPQNHDVLSFNGITHTKHEHEHNVTVVHSVIHQFWSGIHCSEIICVINVCNVWPLLSMVGQLGDLGSSQDHWWPHATGADHKDWMVSILASLESHWALTWSVGQSSSYASACPVYTARSDEIPGGRVGQVAPQLYACSCTQYIV